MTPTLRTLSIGRRYQLPPWDLICLFCAALLWMALLPSYAFYLGPLVLLTVIPAVLLVELVLREWKRL